ncbi:MAG: MFS transporter [Muribaculaceae bacterium]|nr:MFS transporter [Muribaculaceae bacterium]
MIKTGKTPMSGLTYIAIMSVCFIINLPGIAVAPIEGRLREILHTSELEIQLLTTLPNFVIIPFVFIAGKLSAWRHKIPLIVVSLLVFIGCGILYLFTRSMTGLIVASCLLGATDGILIPFAMGFVVNAFEGKYRTRNLGIKSATSNFGTVVASFVVGILITGHDWHLPFVVYLIAVVPLIFCYWLKNIPGFGDQGLPAEEFKKECVMQDNDKGIEFKKIWGLCGNNAFFTFTTFAIVIYLPQLIQQNGWSPKVAGWVIAVFFVSVLLSGFFLELFLKTFRSMVYPLLGSLLGGGIAFISFSGAEWAMYVGSVLAGLAFGIFQPLIYDKTSYAVKDPSKNIFGLSLVLCALYIAIAVEPFIITGISKLFRVHSENHFVFSLSFYLSVAYIIFSFFFRKKFTFLISPSYYS